MSKRSVLKTERVYDVNHICYLISLNILELSNPSNSKDINKLQIENLVNDLMTVCEILGIKIIYFINAYLEVEENEFVNWEQVDDYSKEKFSNQEHIEVRNEVLEMAFRFVKGVKDVSAGKFKRNTLAPKVAFLIFWLRFTYLNIEE